MTSFQATGLNASTTYHFRIRAYDGPNHSAYSNVAVATTQPSPAAPSNLTATPSAGKITLNWTDNATNEAGFKLERSTDGVNFTQFGILGAELDDLPECGADLGRDLLLPRPRLRRREPLGVLERRLRDGPVTANPPKLLGEAGGVDSSPSTQMRRSRR